MADGPAGLGQQVLGEQEAVPDVVLPHWRYVHQRLFDEPGDQN
jgi:hypothetical protein